MKITVKTMKYAIEYACFFMVVGVIFLDAIDSNADYTIDSEYNGIEISGFIFPNIGKMF